MRQLESYFKEPKTALGARYVTITCTGISQACTVTWSKRQGSQTSAETKTVSREKTGNLETTATPLDNPRKLPTGLSTRNLSGTGRPKAQRKPRRLNEDRITLEARAVCEVSLKQPTSTCQPSNTSSFPRSCVGLATANFRGAPHQPFQQPCTSKNGLTNPAETSIGPL